MKNFTLILAIIFLVAGINTNANAQKRSKKVYEGYVITNDNDTIYGSIKMLTPTLNELKVKIDVKGGKENIFKAKDILAYSFQVESFNAEEGVREMKWINYVKRNVEKAPIAFASTEVMIQADALGSLNLFNYYIEQPEDVKNPLRHIYYLEMMNDGSLIELTRKNYEQILRDATIDYPELNAKIGSNGYGFKYVGKIVKEYNDYLLFNTEETASTL